MVSECFIKDAPGTESFSSALSFLKLAEIEISTVSSTHGNKFSVSYCLLCWAWEPNPRPVSWSHSYCSPQVVPTSTWTLLVLTCGLESHPVIIMGFLLISLMA